MKKSLIALSLLALTACADSKTINGRKVNSYGLLSVAADALDKPQDDVEYQLCAGNVFWGIMTSGGIIGPLYFFGFSLYEPVGPKSK